jgi:PAS domain S-box-containing protein
MPIETLIPCGLALLEMTFLSVGLLLLHSLRKLIGSAAFYMSFGLLLVFTQLVGATELKVIVGFPGADFYLAQTVLFLPYLAALMIIYITEGTLATQRLIVGVMATLGLYIYLSNVTATQCGWEGYAISQGPSADSLDYLLRQSKNTLAASALALTLDLFLMPVLFQRLRNLGCRMFFSVLGALMLTQIIDTFVFVTASYWGQPQWWLYLRSSYVAKAFATIWLSGIVTVYLSRVEREIPGEGRGALDIFVAFFGGYGKAQTLQRYLQEWEGRYQMVIENASDLILVIDPAGKILDANQAAVRMFKVAGKEHLIGLLMAELFRDAQDRRIHLSSYVNLALKSPPGDPRKPLHNLQAQARTAVGDKLEFDLAFSVMSVDEQPMVIVFGRDVTEQNRLTRERERLQEQLAHTQRLESIGHLAGGVAHDFNNYIHAIQGHLDILLLMHQIDDDNIVKHLTSINQISEQAAHLTQQLLGFARKGKYREETFDLGNLVHDAVDLFRPTSQKNIESRLIVAQPGMRVRGDTVQITQVFLNIFINARDAMEGKDDDLRLEVEVADGAKFATHFHPVEKTNAQPGDFHCVRVTDTGQGMDKNTLQLIFDPFFTTKPVGKGTGMGLAMVYGAITNHHGLVHVESQEGVGTTFYVFLPKAHDDAPADAEQPTDMA